ncbi:MAG: alginate export family protein, partial [Hyphomonadaceae bacterium]|nr:alginate export family protein [Hyphomonadaceae bacterium]
MTGCTVALPAFVISGSILLATAGASSAQTLQDDPDAPPPTVSRYDEDWSRYCETTTQALAFKCMDVAGGELTLGLGARLRYEIYDPTAFGRGPQDGDGYWLTRAAGHAALTLSPRWRVFGQLFTANAVGRAGGPRPADRNEFDLVQGFLEWRPTGDDGAFVRFGRQEIAFGAGRLLAASEGSNVRRQFDGVRVSVRRGDVTYQAVASGLVQVRPGVLDDSASFDRSLWGVGAVHATPDGSTNAVYYIAARRPDRIFGSPPSIQDRQTLGGRIVRQSARWFGELEVIGQGGEAGGLDVDAWATAGEGAFLTRVGAVRLRAALRFSAASGDGDATDRRLEGFDPLFPNPTYTGSVPLISPTNTVSLNPRVTATWASNQRLSGDVAVIRRLEASDRIYAFSGVAIPAAPDAGDDVGALWSIGWSQ